MRRVGDRALAEDLLQEAFLSRGVSRADTLRDGESVIAWFYRSLRNSVIDAYRRKGAAAPAGTACAADGALSEPDAELQQSVCKCVAQLSGTLKSEYATALQRIGDRWPERAGLRPGSRRHRQQRCGPRFRARQVPAQAGPMTCGTCADHGCLDCHCGR